MSKKERCRHSNRRLICALLRSTAVVLESSSSGGNCEAEQQAVDSAQAVLDGLQAELDECLANQGSGS